MVIGQGRATLHLQLSDGPTLRVVLERDKLSASINNRVLRYTTHWPGS